MLSFSEALTSVLEAFAGNDLPMSAVWKEYWGNAEFKRRIDLAAMAMLTPQSLAIH